MDLTFEVEGAPKPSCVAEVVFRYYACEVSPELRDDLLGEQASVSVSG